MEMAQCCDAVCSNIRDMQARQTPTPSCFAHAPLTAHDESLGAPQATFLRLERAVAGEQTAPGQRGEKGEQRKALYGAHPLTGLCSLHRHLPWTALGTPGTAGAHLALVLGTANVGR